MSRSRDIWDERHADRRPGEPEPFVLEVLPMLPKGLALDVAAGRGRHSLLLARAGHRVVAIDYSVPAMLGLKDLAAAERLPIYPLAADLTDFQLKPECYDAIVNVNFLDRAFLPSLKRALKIGGAMLVDTFLIDQARIGHPRNPDFLLNHKELPGLLSGFELVRHREGLVHAQEGTAQYRASALAFRRI